MHDWLKDEMDLISCYKVTIMSMAILWIMIYHSGIQMENQIFAFVKQIGYGGVDIFFFLSGIGALYSMLRNNDMGAYYRRRMIRIFPVYFPFISIWFLFNYGNIILNANSIKDIVEYVRDFAGNIFMTGWISGLEHQFNWYVQAIIWFYIFVPMLYRYISRRHGIKNYVLLMIFAIGLTVASLGTSLLMATSRIYIFILGFVFAYITRDDKKLRRKEKNNRKYSVFIYIIMIFGIGILYIFITKFSSHLGGLGLWWYPFLFVTPGLSCLFAHIFNLISKYRLGKRLLKFINIIGTATFEIYLIHVALFEFVPRYIEVKTVDRWLILMVCAVVLGIITNKLIFYIRRNYFESCIN